MKFRVTRRQIVLAAALIPAVVGVYILLLVLPTAMYIPPADDKVADAPALQPTSTASQDMLYIPKIGLTIPYLAGGPKTLNENAWHRYPERGDPVKGGNFILSGHRFQLGLTPGATKRRSPFYHINKLEPGDKIYVDFESKRYTYEVVRRFSVKPYQTEVEAPSDTPKLTIYTCTLKGERDGREVVEARPLAESAL